MSETFGEQLRAWRHANGLGQSQIASIIGVTIGAVSHWETGLSLPDETHIRRILDVTGLAVRECPAPVKRERGKLRLPEKDSSELRRLTLAAGLTYQALGVLAGVDPSMITYAKRGLCSRKVAQAIADVLVAANPSLKVDAYLWMLSIGYAPTCLVRAGRNRKRDALAAVGVRS